MGGETIIHPSVTSEEESDVYQDFPLPSMSSKSPTLGSDDKFEDGKNEVDGLLKNGFGQVDPQFNSPLEFEAIKNRKRKFYREVLQSYDELKVRRKNLNEAKIKVLSYVPGAWIENVGGMNLRDYDVPETTTLLLIGPRRSGKSSLVNRISRVFEYDKFAPERAQVSYFLSFGDGTKYLQEYMIPRYSSSFCVYDTPSLNNDTSDNIDMIEHWMKEGVCHGELVFRKSEGSSLWRKLKCKTQDIPWRSCKTRTVNFVIFVVDAVTVLKSIEGGGPEEAHYMQMITRAFKCPYVSFKDDKPVVVITHGDLLSLADRARVRVHLGELLGILPTKQIFDIPESHDLVTELTIADMLRYSLEHADRNLPHKNWVMEKVRKVFVSTYIYLLAMLVIALVAAYLKHSCTRHRKKSELHIDWHAIRHLWLGD
ncbi:putative ATP binding protein [Corchorus capsularis]|uniref:Putative ATP binding protein n=1 Tax=Corchorus capsularis TaxID=210143 RepID=A0A1R3H6R6_COCAP|nr:putative ATP binding protein [Corchorus capsularis]